MIKDIVKSVFPTLMLPTDSENELLGKDDISKTVLSVIKWHIVETWEDLPDDDKRSTLFMYKDKIIEVADPEDRYIGKMVL